MIECMYEAKQEMFSHCRVLRASWKSSGIAFIFLLRVNINHMHFPVHTFVHVFFRSKSKKSDIDVSSLPGVEALSIPGQ